MAFDGRIGATLTIGRNNHDPDLFGDHSQERIAGGSIPIAPNSKSRFIIENEVLSCS